MAQAPQKRTGPDRSINGEETYESFFRCTSRRWIFNEKQRMAERYVRFNVDELMSVAAKAAGRERCANIVKLDEGGYNKVFLLTMTDGYEVIARIPTHIAGAAHWTTASEVATMDFLRTELDIPVPKVLAWSSHADDIDNPVGAEYMILEKVTGDSLCSRWLSLSRRELGEVLQQVVDVEKRISSAGFREYGSLYYKEDVEERLRVNGTEVGVEGRIHAGRFCVGPLPVPSVEAVHGKRMTVAGPWDSPEEYLFFLGRREKAWTAAYGKPRHREHFCFRSEKPIDSKEHIALLDQYELLVPHLLHKYRELAPPALRHPDLHDRNIFLHPNSTKILGIIDWQDARILPYFLQAGWPALCHHDNIWPQTLEEPELPRNFAQLAPSEQDEARKKYRHDEANLSYMAAVESSDPRHSLALRTPHLEPIKTLVTQASRRWDGDLIPLRAALLDVCAKWDDVVGAHVPCPISLTDAEKRSIDADRKQRLDAESALKHVKASIGIDGLGGTLPENYERAQRLSALCRLRVLEGKSGEERGLVWRTWPFKDDDEGDEKPPSQASEGELTVDTTAFPEL